MKELNRNEGEKRSKIKTLLRPIIPAANRPPTKKKIIVVDSSLGLMKKVVIYSSK